MSGSSVEETMKKAMAKAAARREGGEKPSASVQREETQAVVRGRGGHMKAVTVFTKRMTLDLTPEQERALSVWAATHGTKKVRALRAMIQAVLEDEAVAGAVLARLDVEE